MGGGEELPPVLFVLSQLHPTSTMFPIWCICHWRRCPPEAYFPPTAADNAVAASRPDPPAYRWEPVLPDQIKHQQLIRKYDPRPPTPPQMYRQVLPLPPVLKEKTENHRTPHPWVLPLLRPPPWNPRQSSPITPQRCLAPGDRNVLRAAAGGVRRHP